MDPREINDRAQKWIEGTIARIVAQADDQQN
jgi:hypothetical protein